MTVRHFFTGAATLAITILGVGCLVSGPVFADTPSPVPDVASSTPSIIQGQAPNQDDLLRMQIAAKQQQIQQLEVAAQEYRRNIALTTNQASTLKGELSRINNQIKSLQYSISINQAKLEQTQLTIEDLNNNIDTAGQTINDNEKSLASILQTLQTIDDQNELISFFKANNLSEMFNQLAYFDNLQQNLMDKTAFLKTLRQNMQDNLMQAQTSKQQYDSLQQQLSAQKNIAAQQQQEKSTLLANTKNQEQTYQKMLNDTLAKQQQVEQDIEDIEYQLRKTANYTGIPPKGLHIFIKPVANGRVTQGYGNVPRTSSTYKYYKFHNGIDYGSSAGIGTPILAAADGIVRAVGNDGAYAYGKWTAIDHLDGLITLYGHQSYISVSVGQQVKQGDIIGYMGKTGLALGPHLHFTVYLADKFSAEKRWYGLLPLGASVDPNDYL